MINKRRDFLKKSFFIPAAMGMNLPTPFFTEHFQNITGNRLVLLGTQGGPLIRAYKQTPSANLIVYNDIPIVIDTGYGVTFKLIEAGISLSTLQYIFITHHHSDHNLELGPLLYNAWIGGLKTPVNVYGPAGLNDMLRYYWLSNQFDIDTRIRDEARPDIRKLVTAHEYTEGNIASIPGIEVSSLRNIHPPITESFALKFKMGDKAIVFSGDTAYCAPLVKFAAGADFLVHEVMNPAAVEEMVKRRPNAPKLKASILSHHTSTEDAGKIAQEAKVKNLVLNHFVPPDDKSLTDEVWVNAAKTTFSGNIVVGKDLMQLPF